MKKLVMVSVAGLKPVRLHDSSPLVVLSRERLPMMLEFLRSDHEPFLSAHKRKKKVIDRIYISLICLATRGQPSQSGSQMHYEIKG